MKNISVVKLDGIKPYFQEDLYRAMTSCNNKERLLVCLYFMSDLPANRHHLREIERNLRKIFPPSLRDGKTPDDYVDFEASMIRHHFNAETREVKRGQLSPSCRRWESPIRGCWRNTALGNQQAIQILQNQGWKVQCSGKVLAETNSLEELVEREPEEKASREPDDLSEENQVTEDTLVRRYRTDSSSDTASSPKEQIESLSAEDTYHQAIATLLEEIEAALQESLVCHNTAILAEDFETVEIEGERQENLNSAKNQLQVLRDIWPELVGEQQDLGRDSSPAAKQLVQEQEPSRDSTTPRRALNRLIPLIVVLLLALALILICGALAIWLVIR
jgi:hypothetical protein